MLTKFEFETQLSFMLYSHITWQPLPCEEHHTRTETAESLSPFTFVPKTKIHQNKDNSLKIRKCIMIESPTLTGLES